MAYSNRKSNAMQHAKTSTSTEQFIEKCSQEPNMKRKSNAMRTVYNKITHTKKPVCTILGIHNPLKLDLTNYNKAKKEGRI